MSLVLLRFVCLSSALAALAWAIEARLVVALEQGVSRARHEHQLRVCAGWLAASENLSAALAYLTAAERRLPGVRVRLVAAYERLQMELGEGPRFCRRFQQQFSARNAQTPGLSPSWPHVRGYLHPRPP